MFSNRLKKKLKAGRTAFGTFVVINSPDIIEIAGLSGFDFVIIDTEHGPLSVESTQHLIRAAELHDMTPIVRVSDAAPTTILRTLDVGAHGIQVPQINDRESAAAVINGAKYFPIGNRGIAMPRSARYGTIDPLTYFEKSNEETMVIVHCENRQGLANLEAIAAVPEVDVIFLGPFDMSQSLGIPGQVYHPLMDEVVEKVIQVTTDAGKVPGIFVTDGQQAQRRAAQGFKYIAIGMDTTLLAKIYKTEISKLSESV